MTLLFVILIIIAAFVLGLIVLIQNPKGGGLAGSFAGLSTQFMGVKQTTDVLEKGTWLFAGIIGVLCLLSSFFMNVNATSNGAVQDANTKAQDATVPSRPATTPTNAYPLPNTGGGNLTPLSSDSNK
jgi:preprotein translocase subunit SecG